MTTINRARMEMDYAIAADPACVEPGCRRQLLASSGDRVCAAGHDQLAARAGQRGARADLELPPRRPRAAAAPTATR